ncbi:MAG: hypothetical protein ABIA04_12715 [Pseudomonadota bacterium]
MQLLNKYINKRQASGSFLLLGSENKNKYAAFEKYLMEINCLSEDTQKPCQLCTSCVKIKKDIHPDLITIRPEDEIIRIDEIRKMKKVLALSNFESKVRAVAIIDAEKMNIQSQNALLKILEEPPGNTLIFLFAKRIFELLPTIVSRCIRIRFSSLATSLFATEQENQHFDEIIEIFHKRKIDDLYRMIDKMLQDNYFLKTSLEVFLKILSDLVLIKNKYDLRKHVYFKNKYETLFSVSQGFTLREIENIFISAINVYENIDKTFNMQLMLESLFINSNFLED